MIHYMLLLSHPSTKFLKKPENWDFHSILYIELVFVATRSSNSHEIYLNIWKSDTAAKLCMNAQGTRQFSIQVKLTSTIL